MPESGNRGRRRDVQRSRRFPFGAPRAMLRGVNREAFAGLLEPVLDRAYAVALHLTRNPADADDLVQEAALNAFRGFATFQPDTNFRAWFLRIVTNTFLSQRRKHRPEDAAVSLDEHPPTVYMQRQAHAAVTGGPPEAGLVGGDVARAVVGRLETEQISQAIAALPEEFRAAASLYFLGDQSYEQIAATLGVPIGTVRSRLHRGRALLQQRLWQLAEDHGLVKAALAERAEEVP